MPASVDVDASDRVRRSHREVVGAMHERIETNQCVRLNGLPKDEWNLREAGRGSAIERSDLPAFGGERPGNTLAQVARHSGNACDRCSTCHIKSDSEPIRCAFAMTGNVMVLAGTEGSIELSTR